MNPPNAADLRTTLRATTSDLLGYFERRVDSRQDAADLLGEAMLQAWRRVENLPDDADRQRMWLFTIAKNVLSNHRRATRRRTELIERVRSHLASTPPAATDPVEDLAVRQAVARLPKAQRELVMLVHWDGFTLAAAAEILRVNPSTARSRYATARESLKRELNPGSDGSSPHGYLAPHDAR